MSYEVNRRRTFAIISHPDAGKTTLTDKLLLYSGAVHLAGAIRARRNQRYATSDWMALERERGISITTSVLQFEYQGRLLNLLDTPGHQDFSEDTYRTLMAVDSAVMVLDSAKGIEPQTRKLFEVCRLRRLPILTFINKLDRVGRDPLELLDEIEHVLGIAAVPMNWPIGQGPMFQGVYSLTRRKVLRFRRSQHNLRPAPVEVVEVSDPRLSSDIGSEASTRLRHEVELLSTVGARFETTRFLAGELTPVFFGSALNSFGVEPFIAALLDLAPPPRARSTDRGPIEPTSEAFSGFVFKIQANMDPQHRDRMAFLRVCSGRFEKDMLVYHPRLQRKIRMARPHRLFAQDRQTVTQAFPGDVVGLVNPGFFAIGDTLVSHTPLQFDPIPRFAPECFGTLRNMTLTKHKQFDRGVEQLEEEGAIQVFLSSTAAQREPILAAVGELQFDVVVARLRAEYAVEAALERLPYRHARWIVGDARALAGLQWPYFGCLRALDRQDRLVALFPSTHAIEYFVKENPDVELSTIG